MMSKALGVTLLNVGSYEWQCNVLPGRGEDRPTGPIVSSELTTSAAHIPPLRPAG